MKLTEQKLREIIQEELASLNEAVNLKSNLKYLKKHYDATISKDGVISVDGENPFNDGEEYTFYWDGAMVWSGTSMSNQEWSNGVIDVDDFTTLIDSGKLPGGEWK